MAAILGRLARPDTMRILGPAPAPIERIRQRYRWQIVVKSPALNEMRSALASARAAIASYAEHAEVRIGIDIDPVNML
jgi:primosomal protein N' (replication factor Y)